MNDYNELLQKALVLPEDQRAALAHELLLSIDAPADSEVDAAWASEIEKRLEAVDRGEFAEGDWRGSVERIRQALLRK